MKRQTTEQEKMFVNHSSDTALISKINKELIQLNSKKKKSKYSIEKWAEDRILISSKKTHKGTSWWPTGQASALALQGAWIQSLGRELVPCMPHGTANKRKKTHKWSTYIRKGAQHHKPQGNANQNYEISLHTYQNYYNKTQDDNTSKKYKRQKKRNPCMLLVETQIGTATMESSMEVPQEIKNRTTI